MECKSPAVISAFERWAVAAIAADPARRSPAGDCPDDKHDAGSVPSPLSTGLNEPGWGSRRMMLGEWPTETLAAVSGVLCRHYPHLSRFEIVRLVCHVAQSESSAQGGLWLLNCARQRIDAVSAPRTSNSDDPEGLVSFG